MTPVTDPPQTCPVCGNPCDEWEYNGVQHLPRRSTDLWTSGCCGATSNVVRAEVEDVLIQDLRLMLGKSLLNGRG